MGLADYVSEKTHFLYKGNQNFFPEEVYNNHNRAT